MPYVSYKAAEKQRFIGITKVQFNMVFKKACRYIGGLFVCKKTEPEEEPVKKRSERER